MDVIFHHNYYIFTPFAAYLLGSLFQYTSGPIHAQIHNGHNVSNWKQLSSGHLIKFQLVFYLILGPTGLTGHVVYL